jgi:ABC-type transporter Mla MlaB component
MEPLVSPEAEEAVMLYASGRTGDAVALLNRFILDHPASRDNQPWCMLFDLYELTGQRQPFEELALDFAVRFERSPPTWRQADSKTERSASEKHPTFAFGASLSPQDKARLEHFMQECRTSNTVVLDFSKTPVPSDDAYAKLILEHLSRLVQMGKEIQLISGGAFVVRLNASRFAKQLTESTWLLLLMLLQLQAKPDEFDEVAVEYAIHFEISPPSYVPPKHISVEPEPTPAEAAPSGHTFPMHGPLGPGSSNLFENLRKFAEPLPSVEIDLSRVPRVDFAVVGLLMDTVMSLAKDGKTIVFRDGNTMVNLFLQMIGVTQFATIRQTPRK